MPGKQKSRQKASKPKTLGSSESLGTAEDVIQQVPADDWLSVVERLAHYYQLPDLTSRRGLKEFHRDIDVICANLRYSIRPKNGVECLLTVCCFSREAFDGTSSVRLKAGIVGVWGKVACDALIRDQLMERGLFKSSIHLHNALMYIQNRRPRTSHVYVGRE
jgi:hypothetical protein